VTFTAKDQPRLLAEIEKPKQKRREQPRQERRTDAAVIIRPIQRHEGEICDGEQRELLQPAGEFQTQGHRPEQADASYDDPERKFAILVRVIQIGGDRMAEERPEDVAKGKDARPPKSGCIGARLRGHEPIELAEKCSLQHRDL
jgi:hypothetical protein